MNLLGITQILAFIALGFSIAAFAWRLRVFNQLARPAEKARPRGSIQAGVLYAYTLGMAPWAKESTRRHWASYLRGVGFHIGTFLGLGLLVVSPWVGTGLSVWKTLLAAISLLGAVLGLAGLAARWIEPNLKALTTPDDLFATFIVSLFSAAAGLWLLVPAAQPVFYLIGAAMLVYAPFSKIRHCIYFAYSRLFFGKYVGVRAVLPHSQQGVQS